MSTNKTLPVLTPPANRSICPEPVESAESLAPGEHAASVHPIRPSTERPTQAPRVSPGSRIALLLRAAHRLGSFPVAVIRARKGFPNQPRILTHTITFGCNAKCVMCDSWQLPTQGDLTAAQIATMYRKLPRMDAVRLTGGEPFVRRDFAEIYQSALTHLKPMFVYVSTNGFLTERIVQFCESRDQRVPLELAISIDGVGEFHNKIRGNSRAFDSAWQTLSTLSKSAKRLNLSLTVNQTVIDDSGLQQYQRLWQRLESLPVEHHLVVAYEDSATYSLERNRALDYAKQDSLNSFDPRMLAGVLERALKHAGHLPMHRRLPRVYYLRGVLSQLQRGVRRQPTCQALHTHLRLFPNGDVPVCQFNSQIVGNLHQDDFDSLWKSFEVAKQRRWVRECSGCWAECEVAPSALYTLDILKPN